MGDMPQEDMDFLDEHDAASVSKASSSSKGSAKAKGKAKPAKDKLPCLCCDDPRAKGKRFCNAHNRNFDAMRYQAEHADDDDDETENGTTLKEFVSKMSNDAVAREEILAYSRDSPPDRRYARKTIIDWAAFRRRHGVRIAVVDQDRDKPFTEASFLIRCTTKLGLTNSEAKEWWTEFEENPNIFRDNGGFKGAQQLYIPVGRMRMRVKERYVDNAAEEGCNPDKKPKDCHREVLKHHVLAQSSGFANSFFADSASPGTKRPGVLLTSPKNPKAAKTTMLDATALSTLIPKTFTALEKKTASLRHDVTRALRAGEVACSSISELDPAERASDLALHAIAKNLLLRLQLLYRWEGSQSEVCMKAFGITKKEEPIKEGLNSGGSASSSQASGGEKASVQVLGGAKRACLVALASSSRCGAYRGRISS